MPFGSHMSLQDNGTIVELSKDDTTHREIGKRLGYSQMQLLLTDSKELHARSGEVSLQNLYQSMPWRMQAVIAAKGGHTKYGWWKNIKICILQCNKWTCLHFGSILLSQIVESINQSIWVTSPKDIWVNQSINKSIN